MSKDGSLPADVTGNEPYFNPDMTAVCAECGDLIDIERNTHKDPYGVSVDGEKYCCEDCLSGFARLSAIPLRDPVEYFAAASFEKEEVVTDLLPTEAAALNRAAEMAESVWSVKSWVERN